MNEETNRAIVARLYEDLWNTGQLAVADELFTKSERVKHYIENFRKAFPDIQHTIQEVVAEGDTVVVRWSAQGSHMGNFHAIEPTGQRVSYDGVTIAHLVDGKIVEHRTIWDAVALLEQIGVIPKLRKTDGTRL